MDKNSSRNAVRLFALNQKKRDVKFYWQCNVTVDEYLYSDVFVAIYPQIQYSDYRVEITWEDDYTQPDYKIIGLHGYYSSNYISFVFNPSSNCLSFQDEIHNIIINPI